MCRCRSRSKDVLLVGLKGFNHFRGSSSRSPESGICEAPGSADEHPANFLLLSSLQRSNFLKFLCEEVKRRVR